MPNNSEDIPGEVVRTVALLAAALTMAGRPANVSHREEPVEDALLRARTFEKYIRSGVVKT